MIRFIIFFFVFLSGAAVSACALFAPADVVNNMGRSSGGSSSAATITTNTTNLYWTNYQVANSTNVLWASNVITFFNATNWPYVSNFTVTNGTNYCRWINMTNVTITNAMTVITGNGATYGTTNYSLNATYYFTNYYCVTDCFNASYSNISYIRSGNQVFISTNSSAAGIVAIPPAIEGLPVTCIVDHAFANCYGVSGLDIPGTVTNIGQNAFQWCTNLTDVVIPDSVLNIGQLAFNWCNHLTNIVFGTSLASIGYAAFNYCSVIACIVVPNSLTRIDDIAFAYCTNLTNVTISNGNCTFGGPNVFQFVHSGFTVTAPSNGTVQTYCNTDVPPISFAGF